MPYLITYIKRNEQHTLEWIAPTGWSTTAVRESFERQFPQARVLNITPQL